MIKNTILLGLDNKWGHLFWIGKDSNNSVRNIIEFIKYEVKGCIKSRFLIRLLPVFLILSRMHQYRMLYQAVL